MRISSQISDFTMEDSSQNHNGQLGSGTGGNTGNKQNEDNNPKLQYSIPGVLHFIQHEWAKFEMERSQWEVDKAELQARIAFLQGERKGQENLKYDLVRRIKMLEYALRQERAKFHKMQYGTELQQGDMNPPTFDELGVPEVTVDSEAPFTSVSNISWKQGRQLLRQYLQEIGYTDTIIDVRSNRVRSLLGLNNNNDTGTSAEEGSENQGVNGSIRTNNKRVSEPRTMQDNIKKSALKEAILMDTEASVMANFDFLHPDVDMGDEDEDDDDDEEMNEDLNETAIRVVEKSYGIESDSNSDDKNMHSDGFGGNESDSSDWSSRMCEKPAGGGGPVSGNGGASGTTVPDGSTDSVDFHQVKFPAQNMPSYIIDERSAGGVHSTLGLGELAQLTVNNEEETTYDDTTSKESSRKPWNAKYTLRSHFDSVRALAFHPIEPVLITASEDHTLKLWNLQKTVTAKKSASLDVEPLYTFRSHTGPVLCLAMSSSGEQCYSGGTDGIIRCWNMPSYNIDPYNSFDPRVLAALLEGHTDAIWGLSTQNNESNDLQLLSCSADGTVKLWSPSSAKSPLLNTYSSDQDGCPTSVDFTKDGSNQMITSYTCGTCVVYDLETAKPVVHLDSLPSDGLRHINRIVSHPTISLSITAHEDRHIRFFDHKSGKMVHAMVAHLDSVTSLAVDPNGLYLLSGSHDCSIRLWNLDHKSCVQEITAHRKKFDESILDVAFHPSSPFIASGGADSLAKVFV